MWLNWSVETINVTLQILDIYIDYEQSKVEVQSLWKNAPFINSTNITIAILSINPPWLHSWTKNTYILGDPNILNCQTLHLCFGFNFATSIAVPP